MYVTCSTHNGKNQKGFGILPWLWLIELRQMLMRVRESGTETATASDVIPRLAMPMFLPRLLLLDMLASVPVLMLASSPLVVVRCFRFWEAMNVCASVC